MFYPKKKEKACCNTKMHAYEIRHYIADKLISKEIDLHKFNQIIGVRRKK